MPAPPLILCATSRLAQSLRWQDNRAHVAAGDAQWPTLNTATVAQWFAALAELALLRGSDNTLLQRRALDSFQEALLWEQVISESIPDYATEFFDIPGMAATAAEAHKLMVVWGIAPDLHATDDGSDSSDEAREFLRWRKKFLALCDRQGLIDAAQLHEAVLNLVAGGAVQLPASVFFAGFDNITPQERRLKQILAAQGVTVTDWQFDETDAPSIEVCMLPEADAERRAVAAWAAAQLAQNPAVQLGIVVPNLGKARDAIESALDDALHPSLLRPAHVEVPRVYNFSLGKPLTQYPLVTVALDLIELCCGAGNVEQARLGELLRQPFWSASVSETDARARLEALMREQLPATTSVLRLLSLAQWFDQDNETKQIPQLITHLQAIEARRGEWKKKASPSMWAARFRQMLRAAGWLGLGGSERKLSSHEFQARGAFEEELDKLAALDGIVGDAAGNISARDAHHRLTQLASEHVFQAETTNEPQVQVVGMLEAGGMHFDALWVMGMTDDVWPPAPRPNPLLPAELQRKARSPNASAQAQREFADSIQQRLLQCAPDITFSFARMEGATELRPTPLLPTPSPLVGEGGGEGATMESFAPAITPLPNPLPQGERELNAVWADPVDDSTAPAVGEGEHVRGGTGLLKAQAICPAWAYFRYRLGAKELQTPVEGLDAAARGSIVHDALRAFWQSTGSSAALRAMADAERNAAIDKAADAGLDEYDLQHPQSRLPPVFRTLERERLQRLLGNWLQVELGREQPFSIVSCEETLLVNIEGIECRLQIDRIDQLEDGRRIVIDYKTGAVPGIKSWAEARITDPQLPIYAAIAQSEQATAAVAFGKVQLDDSVFVGIAADEGLLPRVAGVDSRDGRKVFSADQFADWQAVLRHWRSSIEELAHDVKAGDARVMVTDEASLRYCDVRPILRLAERRSQWEAALQQGAEK